MRWVLALSIAIGLTPIGSVYGERSDLAPATGRLGGTELQAAAAPAARETNTQRLLVSANRRFVTKADGTPFFWLGDTAWRLHRLDPDELAFYLDTRKTQGFNVVQGPILTFDSPDYRGLRNDDPTRPNEEFFRHIDRIVEETDRRGLYTVLVVAWGHAFNSFGDVEGARRYGRWLAHRYRSRNNVIWIVAGEYAIDSWDESAIQIWRAIGEGLREGSSHRHLITVHGSWTPVALQTSSTFYHAEPWLDFNMIQSSQGGNHGPGAASWLLIEADYRKTPPKPVIDGEATYEQKEPGKRHIWDGFGVRRRAYWSVFAGGFGHTYGAADVFYFEDAWRPALFWEGGASMVHLRRLMESRPMLTRIPEQGVVSASAAPCADRSARPPCDIPSHLQATRDSDGSYAMVYIPGGERSVAIDSTFLSGRDLVAWWYDPSDGTARRIGIFRRGGTLNFTAPPGRDWVLVIDDMARRYPAPGARAAPDD
jgi:hypothetical protein